MATARTILDMPNPSSKSAPKKFKGCYDEVQDFLDRMDHLYAYNNVTDNAARCKTILLYTSTQVRETIEAMSSFRVPDWNTLKTAILHYFNADKTGLKFRESELITFVKESKKEAIRTLAQFRGYQRKFIRIAGWLLGKNKITQAQHDKYFWKGLPRILRPILEHRISQVEPNFDSTNPFRFNTIQDAAEYHFKPNRFDADDDTSELDKDSDSDSDESDSDSDISDSDDGVAKKKKKKDLKKKKLLKMKKSKKMKKGSGTQEYEKLMIEQRDLVKKKEEKKPEERKFPPSNPYVDEDFEMELLLTRISQTPLDSPEYPSLYYRATSKAPQTAALIAKPAI